MHLEPQARKYYQLKIVTEPVVSGTWSASFDGGNTWVSGEEQPGDLWRWLVAGPEFDEEGAVVADYTSITDPVTQVLIKLEGNPEVIVEDASTIYIDD